MDKTFCHQRDDEQDEYFLFKKHFPSDLQFVDALQSSSLVTVHL